MLGVFARFGLLRLSGSQVWSIVGVNIAGSFLLGLMLGGAWFSRDARDVLGIGFLGGFTTFSTFSAQIVLDVDAGEPRHALLYLAASVAGGVAAAAVGFAVGRALR